MLIESYTGELEMKCSGDSEILHEIVCDTTRKSEKHKLICVVSQNPRHTLYRYLCCRVRDEHAGSSI